MTSTILLGDCRAVIPTMSRRSVDCVVTSPPYWLLRSYLPSDHPAKALELGQEATPAEYVANLVGVFALIRDVLTDRGVCWINVGDSYSHDSRGGGTGGKHIAWHRHAAMSPSRTRKAGGPSEGNMCLIPQRLMIALQDDGWIVRSQVIWQKPSAMPSSLSSWQWVRCRRKLASAPRGKGKRTAAAAMFRSANSDHDGKGFAKPEYEPCPGCEKCEPHGGYRLRRGAWRPTSSYEPVIMIAKQERYFADGVAVEQPAKSATLSRNKYTRIINDPDEQFAVKHDHEVTHATANLRDVWSIPAEPLHDSHYAAYPSELASRCIRASVSQRGYCRSCGEPWVRVVEKVDTGMRQKKGDNWDTGKGAHGSYHRNGREKGERDQPVMAAQTTGWRPTCGCDAGEPRGGVVLDPFAGSGRTGVAAIRLGCDFIGIELFDQFAAMASRQVNDEAGLFAF